MHRLQDRRSRDLIAPLPELTIATLRWSWSFRLVLLFFSCSPRRPFFSSHSVFFPISLSPAPTVRPLCPPTGGRIARRRKEGVDDPRKEGKRERGLRGKVAEGWVIN